MRNENQKGFGLIELMISLIVLSFFLLGAYMFMGKHQRAEQYSTKSMNLSKRAMALRIQLLKRIRNIGYNPNVVEYETDPVVTNFDKYQMGITSILPTELLYNADDDQLPMADGSTYGCSFGACAPGLIEPSEHYAIWLASSVTASPIDLSSKLDMSMSSTEPCTLAGGQTFEDTYNLYVKVKQPPADPLQATIPTVLATDVACLEVRVFARGDTTLGEDVWERLHESRDGTNFDTPDHPDNGGDAETYYQFIRDTVGKIQIGVLLVGEENSSNQTNADFNNERRKLEQFVIETRITNRPWIAMDYEWDIPG